VVRRRATLDSSERPLVQYGQIRRNRHATPRDAAERASTGQESGSMQLIVAGTLDDGRSGVVGREPLAEETRVLWEVQDVPPRVDRPRSVPSFDIGVRPGAVRFMLVNVAADATNRDMHRADALSHSTVVSGSIELLLESERVPLGPGDCVV